MSNESGQNRWWENYLVRYLMPSIAGVAIVSWICSYAGDGFRKLLFLPTSTAPLDTPTLTLMFLYGNLFCYIASYPILIFHVTRVMDFTDGRWPSDHPLDGYFACLILLLVILIRFHDPDLNRRFWTGIVLAGFMSVIQIARLFIVLFPRIHVRGLDGTVSPAFGFAYALARRRGIPKEIEKKRSITSTDEVYVDVEGEEVKAERIIEWRRELISSYRHLREHGNSGFIFMFELALAALASFVVTKPGQTPQQQLGALGALFTLWSLPVIFVHLLGQHLERRFSKYDQRIVRDS